MKKIIGHVLAFALALLILFALGFFRPERRREALLALDMMDFEGIERVKGALAGE